MQASITGRNANTKRIGTAIAGDRGPLVGNAGQHFKRRNKNQNNATDHGRNKPLSALMTSQSALGQSQIADQVNEGGPKTAPRVDRGDFAPLASGGISIGTLT